MLGSVTPTAGNKNLYNGSSEWQDDFGNLPDLQQTFYRNYDAALGRFIGVDPVAEAADDMSTYHYAANIPVMFNDPLGDQVVGYQEVEPVFHGGHRRIGAGSGNNWSNGINRGDWDPWTGSESYRAGIAAGAKDIGGDLYIDGNLLTYNFLTGSSGYWVRQDIPTVNDKKGDGNLNTVNISSKWIEVSKFLENNWKDIGFLATDLAKNFINQSTTYAISRGYNLARTTVFVGSLATRVSTKLVGGVSKTASFAAKAAPWVSGGSIVIGIAVNKQVTAGDVYQSIVTGASLIPGWGLIIGGGALLLEGGSYYFTGKSVSDNINSKLKGGVIYSWK